MKTRTAAIALLLLAAVAANAGTPKEEHRTVTVILDHTISNMACSVNEIARTVERVPPVSPQPLPEVTNSVSRLMVCGW